MRFIKLTLDQTVELKGRMLGNDDYKICKDRVALTSCSITLIDEKPQNTACPKEIRTIGDHIRKIRLDRGMLQKVVVILAGINDIAGNTGYTSVEIIAENIKSMAELAQYHKIKVVLCSVLPAVVYKSHHIRRKSIFIEFDFVGSGLINSPVIFGHKVTRRSHEVSQRSDYQCL